MTVVTLASHRAAPSTPDEGASTSSPLKRAHAEANAAIARLREARALDAKRLADPNAILLHAQAENALALALHYLRLPESNVPGATRKAVQALAALSRLHKGA